MDSSTYRHIVGQLTKSCFIPHNHFPSHNLLAQETLIKFSKDLNDPDTISNDQFLDNFPCYQPFKYQVEESTALFCGSGAIDIAKYLVKRKLNWERQLKNIKVHNVKKAVSYIKKFREDETTKLPRDVRKYINHFHKDPEPKFEGSYNWLYTGGNLFGLEVENGVVLLSSEFTGRKAGFNILKLNKSLNKVETTSVCDLSGRSPLLQISSKKIGESVLIIARQKNNLSLFKMNNTDSFTPRKLWRKKSKHFKLLTCADINNTCDKVSVSDSDNVLHVFDVETRKKTFWFHCSKSMDIGSKKDGWNQVILGDDYINVALRSCFCVIDSRDRSEKPKLTFQPPTVTNTCEDICSMLKSKCDCNYLYLGTTHSLLQLDIRNCKTVQKWTHLMNNPLQFMSGIRNENEEFLVMQSSEIEELVAVNNDFIKNGDEVYFISRSLPCLLQDVKESLRVARYSGLCLSPSVAKRFDCVVTGVQCFKTESGDFHLFTENGAGDIFLSKIREKTPNEVEESACETELPLQNEAVLDSMKMYEAHVENMNLKKTHQSCGQIVNMEHVLKAIRKPVGRNIKYKKPEIDWKNEKMFEPERLLSYKDALAPKILKVWGFIEEDTTLHDTTMSSDAKVLEWMEKF